MVSMTPQLKASEVNNNSPILATGFQRGKPKRAVSLVDADPEFFEIEHESLDDERPEYNLPAPRSGQAFPNYELH